MRATYSLDKGFRYRFAFVQPNGQRRFFTASATLLPRAEIEAEKFRKATYPDAKLFRTVVVPA